jgi:peptidoglycan/LPS O-acetylase OafA/YrhL
MICCLWLLAFLILNIKRQAITIIGIEEEMHNLEGKTYIQSLTGLRFFAAIFVVVAHVVLQVYGRLPDQISTYLTSLSGLGMPLFFILSGFVIHYTYSDILNEQGVMGKKKFWIARFARLYPLYIIVLLIHLLTVKNGIVNVESLSGFLRHLTLTQTWSYEIIGTNNLVYLLCSFQVSNVWSISTEVFLYLSFPLILFFLNKVKSIRSYVILGSASLLLCFILMYVVFIYTTDINQIAASTFGPIADYHTNGQNCFVRWFVYFFPFFWIFLFATGCCAAAVFIHLKNTPVSKTEQKIGFTLLIMGLMYLVIVYLCMFTNVATGHFHQFIKFSHYNCGLAPALTLIIFCCARYRNAFSRFMESPMIVKLGDASYSIYLLHALVMFFVLKLEFVQLFSPFSKVLFIISCVLGLSIFSYQTIEVPCRRWIRNMFRGRTALVHGKRI